MKIFLVLILYLFITVLSHIVGDGNLISSDSKKEDINIQDKVEELKSITVESEKKPEIKTETDSKKLIDLSNKVQTEKKPEKNQSDPGKIQFLI
jgi:hypothetical protein